MDWNIVTALLGAMGTLLLLLLSVIGFFLRQLHIRFCRMEKDLTSLEGNSRLMKAELRSSCELLRQRIGFLELKKEGLC